jgi:hypothetical protein
MMAWMKSVLQWSAGRTTGFAAFFALSATVLEWAGHLTMTYVAAIGAIQALVLAHSTKEDYFDKKVNNGPLSNS